MNVSVILFADLGSMLDAKDSSLSIMLFQSLAAGIL
jgi:hypothetical protein